MGICKGNINPSELLTELLTIKKKYHKNSSEYKDYTIWFMMECERLRNSEKYLNICNLKTAL